MSMRSPTGRALTPILIVEDDPRLPPVLTMLLAGGPFAPTLVATAREALARLDEIDPRIVLVDLGLPDLDGVELIAELARRRPSTPALVLTSSTTEERIRAALRAGARGYLFKEDLGPRLAVAIDEALHGGVPMSKAVAELLLAEVRGTSAPSSDRTEAGVLTPREQAVLERLARSLTYEETAADLGVSVNTVRTYVRAIYDKLAVSTRTEAVIAALDRGLIRRG